MEEKLTIWKGSITKYSQQAVKEFQMTTFFKLIVSSLNLKEVHADNK